MKPMSTATFPAAYTNSFAAGLTVAATLGLAAGATTAKAWQQQATDDAISGGSGAAQHDFRPEGR